MPVVIVLGHAAIIATSDRAPPHSPLFFFFPPPLPLFLPLFLSFFSLLSSFFFFSSLSLFSLFFLFSSSFFFFSFFLSFSFFFSLSLFSRRALLARAERPLLLTGLVLVTAHLLDLALSGPTTSCARRRRDRRAAAAWALAQPHVTRPTRLALGVVVGAPRDRLRRRLPRPARRQLGPDWRDLTGVGYIVGGLLLVAAGIAATAAPRRAPRRRGLGWRGAHALAMGRRRRGRGGGRVLPFAVAQPHHPRSAVGDRRVRARHPARGRPHRQRRRRRLSAWYVPSRNGAAVLLSHGSVAAAARPGSRADARPPRLRRAGARQPRQRRERRSLQRPRRQRPAGLRAGLDYLEARPDVNPQRIAGFGLSLGGEVLLEAAAHDHRLAAVSPTARPARSTATPASTGAAESALGWLMGQRRAVSGMSRRRRSRLMPDRPASRAPRRAADSPPRSPPRACTATPAAGASRSGSCPTPATPRACASTRPRTSGARSASSTARSPVPAQSPAWTTRSACSSSSAATR